MSVIWADHGGYLVDHGGYLRIMTVICTEVGSRDAYASKMKQARNLERCALKAAKLQHGKLKTLHT